MNVLAITCHPDDMEINCAGTLLKCLKRGDKVTVCHVCNGSHGHMVIMPDELKEIRKKEAVTSGNLVGFEVVTCDINDLHVYESIKEQRDKVVDVIRKVQPDVIITHSPNDYMPDHNAVSRLAFDASFAASVPHYETKEKQASKVVPIYYMETLNGVDFNPTHYVDITEEMDTKVKMLECHESQYVWLKEHVGVDVGEEAKIIAAFRGLQCGKKYAEAFTQCMVANKLSTERLLP